MTLNVKITDTFLENVVGIKNIRENKNNFQASCPFAKIYHENGIDNKPSFSIHKEKGYWNCFTCHQKGDLIGLLMRVRQIPYNEAASIVKQAPTIKNRREYIGSIKQRVTEQLTKPDISLSYFIPEEVEFSKQAIKYLYRRGIDDDIISHFKLYYTEDNRCPNRVIFPSYNNNKIICWSGRYVGDAPLGTPKYYMSPGMHKSVVYSGGIFNEKIYLVEGVFDVLTLWRLGLKNVGGILGTTFTKEQARFLLTNGIKEICLMLDGDMSGQTAATNIVEEYKQYFRFTQIVLDNGIDPDSIVNNKELSVYLSSEQPF